MDPSAGAARIATTIRGARENGPTIVVDAGDSVFGSPTFWSTRGAGPTARLRGVAGYQLAAIGNHDLEHGLEGLRELLEGGYRLVANNLRFGDAALQRQIAPAYVAQVSGFRIGFTGVTTLDTVALVPRRMLQGVEFLDAIESTVRTVRALDPYVDAIVVLSHLGFDQAELVALMPDGRAPRMMEQNDRQLAPHLKGTKVAAILGGHTHDALEPAPLIAGIAVCNAGAYGVKVGEVKLRVRVGGAMEVRNRLLDQDESVLQDADLLEARGVELRAFAPLTDLSVPIAEIELSAQDANGRHSARGQQYQLLRRALNASRKAAGSAIMMVPQLYGRGVEVAEVDDRATYTVITSELVAEGGLHWTALPEVAAAIRPLEVTCADLVWDHLLQQANAGKVAATA